MLSFQQLKIKRKKRKTLFPI
ncbi:putative membrane protein, partial [Vibrio parahaemolyticus 970107]